MFKFKYLRKVQQRDEIRIKPFSLHIGETNLLTILLRLIYEQIFITEKTTIC